MGKDWRYGRKARRKLSAPKINFWKNNMESKIKTFYLENLLPVLIKENLRQ
jgi:hypothetical protein